MSEKTNWFYSGLNTDNLAVVLLAHGLNLRPDKMDELAGFFIANKCDVLRISLGANPDNWENIFEDDYESALRHAQKLDRELYFVGFSLGALMGVHYILKHGDHQIKKMALLAPATHTHWYTSIPAILGYLFPSIGLPSLNLENYRERNNTTLNEYKKMRDLQRRIKKELEINTINIDTLLITGPHDELVDNEKLNKFAQSNPHWSTLEVTNSKSPLIKKYNHLMIDSQAIGPEQWEILLKHLKSHFAL